MEFLAYEWNDPAPVVVMMIRLIHPPFDPAEIAKAWIWHDVRRVEWWMTKIGTFPNHYHRFRFLNSKGAVVEERIQWGYAGNLVKAEENPLSHNFRSVK